jgi:hypothetical protein
MQVSQLVTSSIAIDDDSFCQPKFASVSAAGNGNNTLVAAVTGKKIRVLSMHLTMSGTTVTWAFQSGAGGTALTGTMGPIAQGVTVVWPFNPLGHFQTAASTLLNLSLSGAQTVAGSLVYIEVD